MHEQLAQLRNALFAARALGRALVLPRMLCSCELGFWPNHIAEDCKASDHETLRVPYRCPIDHFLDPAKLLGSPYAHRERSFFANPRTPAAIQRSTVAVTPCADPAGCSAPSAVVTVPVGATIAQLRRRLGGVRARVLHFTDISRSLGGFEPAAPAAEVREWHEDAQQLLSSWCCTAHPHFKRTAGVIPYLLPPMPGQSAWHHTQRLEWAVSAVAELFEASDRADDAAIARQLRQSAAGVTQ